MTKKKINDLAIFGGDALFSECKSTSNLLKPDIEKFLNYSKEFFIQRQFTNNGPNVQLLEKRLAKFHHTKYCLAFSSGFWALVLAIKALCLEGKSEIIMPSLTYRRMSDMAAWVGLKPKFCEVDEESLAMTVKTVLPCINERTALILGVHPIVNCCESQALVELAQSKGIPILFDSVESVYEHTSDGKVGGFGEAECFSLHACKLFNGFGGGYLTTNSKALTNKLSAMRTFGFVNRDSVEVKHGLNAKLNEMHACMALASLDDIDIQINANKKRYHTYKEQLALVRGLRLLKFDENYESGYKNIVVEVLQDWPFSRDETIQILNEDNILARPHYYPPLHRKDMLFDFVPAHLPLTDELAQRFINLPCGQKVSNNDIKQIVCFLLFIQKYSKSIKARLNQGTEI